MTHLFVVTGADIVRWEGDGTIVLEVHGAFDGASAWALRHAIEESPAREFLVDLGHAAEACEFAAGLLAVWTRRWGRMKRVRFRPGGAEHERLLAGHGLELADDLDLDPDLAPLAEPAVGDPFAQPLAESLGPV